MEIRLFNSRFFILFFKKAYNNNSKEVITLNHRKFKTEKEFLDKFKEYIDYCEDNERLANIAGFAVYSKINRDTFYAQKEFYPEAFSMIQDILEDYTLNAEIYHTLKIFYLKCKFKYNDHNFENMAKANRVTIVDDLPEGEDDD